jgi:hypothetical protein
MPSELAGAVELLKPYFVVKRLRIFLKVNILHLAEPEKIPYSESLYVSVNVTLTDKRTCYG